MLRFAFTLPTQVMFPTATSTIVAAGSRFCSTTTTTTSSTSTPTMTTTTANAKVLENIKREICNKTQNELQLSWCAADTSRYQTALFYLPKDLRSPAFSARATSFAKKFNIPLDNTDINCTCCGHSIESHMTRSQQRQKELENSHNKKIEKGRKLLREFGTALVVGFFEIMGVVFLAIIFVVGWICFSDWYYPKSTELLDKNAEEAFKSSFGELLYEMDDASSFSRSKLTWKDYVKMTFLFLIFGFSIAFSEILPLFFPQGLVAFPPVL